MHISNLQYILGLIAFSFVENRAYKQGESIISDSNKKNFLSEFEFRPGDFPKTTDFKPIGLILGNGSPALEVLVYNTTKRPRADVLKKVWNERQGGRGVPLLVVALQEGLCHFCGHTEKLANTAHTDLPIENIELLCRAALQLPNHHSVDRFLREHIRESDSPIFGIVNHGLLATYVIQRGKEEVGESDWLTASRNVTEFFSKKELFDSTDHRKLLNNLGYTIESLKGPAYILTSDDSHLALAILLDQNESAELPSGRFGNQTPISSALQMAQTHNLEWVIVCRGSELRLYPTRTGVGVGQRGLTDTYLSLDINLLPESRLPFLWLTMSAEALRQDGFISELRAKSHRFATNIGKRLRERIYTTVIPKLAMAIVKARGLKKPSTEDLELTYQMAMLVLFRLLFIAYAEDHDLLPYRSNSAYKARSLTQKARELIEVMQKKREFDTGTSHWEEVNGLWDAVRAGHKEWEVPPYDGGLFEEDKEKHPAGYELSEIKLSNRDFGVVLTNVLLDQDTPEGLGPVDFRSLGVREFGTIYEGLLENELSVAEQNLTTDKKGHYKPTDDKKKIEVRKNEIYLHNRSGVRKATGSYYTKSFAVEHLLDHSLEPALNEHLKKVEALAKTDSANTGKQLFEFYVADIAMGSGHFLIAAIDRIEKRFITFLGQTPLKSVDDELEKLRIAAKKTLGEAADERQLEKNQLLRRLIARRCIYGVDLNPLAVELARLSMWIHTFVPGLPLSFLDHNLVCGNSLVGIGTFDEAIDELTDAGANYGLFDDPAKKLLEAAADDIRTLRELSDADMKDIKKAKDTVIHMEKVLSGLMAILDVLSATRISDDIKKELRSGAAGFLTNIKNLDTLFGNVLHKKARKVLSGIPPFHFPIAFPEIFLRDTPGFDVIIGNPPWEEAMADENEFWGRHFPGLRGLKPTAYESELSQLKKTRKDLVKLHRKEQESAALLRQVLHTGPFPGMGTGHPDLYKAFSWRFWHLIRNKGGLVGVVLPRAVWFAKGSAQFRKTVMEDGQVEILTYLLNNRKWVFAEVHPQYTIVLTSISKGKVENPQVSMRGPFGSKESFYSAMNSMPVRFNAKDVLTWSHTGSIPLLPNSESANVFLQLRKAPCLDANIGDWDCRPIQGDINATFDKNLMTFSEQKPRNNWPVYKGESFDLWNPDTGSYYAWAEPEQITKHLQDKRKRGHRTSNSAFSLFSEEWINNKNTLSCLSPRLVFRDITNRTNRRTIISALIPANIIMSNQAPFFLWANGNAEDMVFLLSLLSSIPLDWYARRFVESHLNFHILMPFPVPRPKRSHIHWKRIIQLGGRLACPDDRFAEFAMTVNVQYGPLKDDEKEDMIHELDAVVAHLYGLTEKQLVHIFETFHVGWDYEDRLKATLKHFKEWKKKL